MLPALYLLQPRSPAAALDAGKARVAIEITGRNELATARTVTHSCEGSSGHMSHGMPQRPQNRSTENTVEKKTRRCQGGLTGELAVFNQFPVCKNVEISSNFRII